MPRYLAHSAPCGSAKPSMELAMCAKCAVARAFVCYALAFPESKRLNGPLGRKIIRKCSRSTAENVPRSELIQFVVIGNMS